MTTMRDVINSLTHLGWSLKRDEVGDLYGILQFRNRTLQIIPTIQKRSDHYRVFWMPSVSTISFNNAQGFIKGDNDKEHVPLISKKEQVHIVNDLAEVNTETVTQQLIEWANEQDTVKQIEFLSSLSTDSKGTMPVYHLAALALLGNIEKLEYYLASFHNGNRLGFVPYIKEDMLERAIQIAKENSQD
ncbi:TPA: hypothetical protein ACK11E_004505 [Citrobacter pasteurii]|uniref:DUF6990 domain-containing protein n=1 Tax=Citrobacter freundii TaxID=546 RepID=UPI0015F3B583|nr:hypothetical protein [Citrobacter freundii]